MGKIGVSLNKLKQDPANAQSLVRRKTKLFYNQSVRDKFPR